jgi:hypothetical protein
MRLLLVGKMSACMRCGKADPRWSVRIGSREGTAQTARKNIPTRRGFISSRAERGQRTRMTMAGGRAHLQEAARGEERAATHGGVRMACVFPPCGGGTFFLFCRRRR